MTKTYPWDPDYAVPPGDSLAEWMESHNLDAEAFAISAGMRAQDVAAIIDGTLPINATIAAKLKRVTGIPRATWYGLEYVYREQLRKIEAKR